MLFQVNQLYEAVNVSEPSFIRVEADEVTYPMHVILRYEIEKGLFDGSVEINTLPELWNSKMKEYLGVEPPSDTLGCFAGYALEWGCIWLFSFLYVGGYLCEPVL